MSVIDSKSWKWRRRRLGWPEPIAFWMAFREAWYGRKGRGAPFSTLCLSPREKIGGGGGVRDATYQVFLPIRHQDHPLPQAHDLGRDIGRRAARVVLCARSEQLVDGFFPVPRATCVGWCTPMVQGWVLNCRVGARKGRCTRVVSIVAA